MTTTTERIASAIAPIIAEEMREYRERIAILERNEKRDALVIADLEHTLADLNRQLDEAHKKNARLVLENAKFYQFREAAPVEEQGPWVVYDEAAKSGEVFGGRSGLATPYWNPLLKECLPFATFNEAELSMRRSVYAPTSRVITLAEARAIEAKRNG